MIEVKHRSEQLDVAYVDQSLLTINNCNIAGLRIDGVEIAPLLAQRKTTHG